jgi:hypothetical protein
MKQVLDYLKFAGKQFEPFSTRGYRQASSEGAPPLERALPFVGITRAPHDVGASKAEKLAESIARGDPSGKPRTQAQADKSQLHHQLVQDLRNGKPDALGRAKEAQDAGKLNDQDVREIQTESKLTPLQARVRKFSAEDAAKVYEAASPEEQKQLHDLVRQHITNSKTMTHAEQDKKLSDLGIQPPPELEMQRELHDLSGKAKANSDAKEKYASLARQITAADTKGDAAKGEELRNQAREVRKSAPMTEAERNRHADLQDAMKTITEIRKRMDEGTMQKDEGEKKIAQVIKYAK